MMQIGIADGHRLTERLFSTATFVALVGLFALGI
jgi:hypothetical protein